MKKNCVIILTIVLVFTIVISGVLEKHYERIYPITARVAEIDRENDKVIIKTATDIGYCFYGVEDYEEGDFVSCIMDNMGTESVEDDKVLKVRFSAF